MEIALNHYFSNNGMALALNIFNFPGDYDYRPSIKSRALRYLFNHRKKYPSAPSHEQLSQFCTRLFEEFTRLNYMEGMREIADIAQEYCNNREFMDRLPLREEPPEEPIIPNREEHDYNNDLYLINLPRQLPQADQKTVYKDGQNVHNSNINSTVMRVFSTLYERHKDKFVLTAVEEHEIFYHKTCILTEICTALANKYTSEADLINNSKTYIIESTAIFTHQELGMIDAFISIWLWIQEQEHKDELEKRLLEELKSMEGYCTTGHIARFMNVIQGFTDDPTLQILISEKDQYTSVIKNYLSKKLKECEDEKVVEGLLSGSDEFVRFIRLCVSEKLLEWKKEYGSDIIKYLPKIVNDFSGTTVYVS
jgi:hypothetical protein